MLHWPKYFHLHIPAKEWGQVSSHWNTSPGSHCPTYYLVSKFPVVRLSCSVHNLNSLRPRQNGRLFADDTFKRIFLTENIRISTNKANLRDLIAATGLVISNWIQIVNFSARVTVEFDGWPCKTIGHLFYATSSFVHLFVPIGEFKLKLQSGNAQSGSNWMIFRAVRPWNLTDDLAKQ